MHPLTTLLWLFACKGEAPEPGVESSTNGSIEFVVRSAPSMVALFEGAWTVRVLAAEPDAAGPRALGRGLGVPVEAWKGGRPQLNPGQLAVLWVPSGADLGKLQRALELSGGPGGREAGALVVALAPGDPAWRQQALERLPWVDVGILDPVLSASLWGAAPKLSDEAAGALAAEVAAESFPGLRYTPTTLGGLPVGLAEHLGAKAAIDAADPRVRAEAAHEDPAALLADPQVAVRLTAASQRPDALAKDPEPLVRARAADGSVDPALLAQLSVDSSSVVRVIATHSLARLAAAGKSSPEVVAALVAAAGSPDAYQRWKAAYGLAYVPEGREVLVRLLREDRDIDVRREAAHGLSMHRGPEVREALLLGLGDSNSFVRRWSAYGLGRIEDPTVVEALRKASEDPTALVAGEAAMALQRYGGQARVPDYRGLGEPPDLAEAERLSRNPDATLRKDLCKSLVRLPGAVDILMRLARDPDSEVRKAAVEALGWMDDPQIDLSAGVADPDPDTIVAALEAVRQGRRAAVSAVGARLADPDTEIRLRAAEALAALSKRGAAGAAELLLQAIGDPDERVRAAVISVHPDRLAEGEPAVLVRRAAAAAGAATGDADVLVSWAMPGAEADQAAWAAGVLTREDELLHLRFSWNRPEDQPASHRALRPPLVREYGHPNRG